MAEEKASADKIAMILGVATLLAILTGISSAQHMPPPEEAMDPEMAMDPGLSEGRTHRAGMPFMGVPVEMIVGGGGFAFQGNETHLLKLNVERISPLEPGQIRSLLVSNKSIEEIREAIKAEEGRALYRGSMRLDDISYPLTDIDVRPLNDTSTIVDADVSSPGSAPENQTDTIGRLNMTVSISKGGRIGEGQLEMNSTEHKGSYHVLLDMANHEMHFRGLKDYIRPERQKNGNGE